MMKIIVKFIFIIALLHIEQKGLCQIDLIIDSLIISNIKPNIDTSQNETYFWEEHEEEGPRFAIFCSLVNKGTDNISISTAHSIAWFSFFYKKEYFIKELEVTFFEKVDTLKPNTKLSLFLRGDFFLNTSIWQEKKIDYTTEIISILPTIKLLYWDSIHSIKVYRTENVIILE